MICEQLFHPLDSLQGGVPLDGDGFGGAEKSAESIEIGADLLGEIGGEFKGGFRRVMVNPFDDERLRFVHEASGLRFSEFEPFCFQSLPN